MDQPHYIYIIQYESVRQTYFSHSYTWYWDILKYGTLSIIKDPYVIIEIGGTKQKTKVHK